MATITRENIGLLNDKLVLTVSKEDYLPAFEKSIKQYAKTAAIPGFRKGMVPASVIKKMHGQAVFNEQVFQVIDKTINNYISENKIQILAQPLPLEGEKLEFDYKNPTDYTVNFEIGLQPEININVADIKATRYQVEVSDKTVEAEIENAQLRAGEYTTPETIENEEDVINIEMTSDDKTGASSVYFKDFSKSGAKLFKGKKVDDVVEFDVAKAIAEASVQKRIINDLGLDKETSAKGLLVSAKITKIGRIVKAELNEAFFEKVYPGKDIKTEEAYKAELKNDILIYFNGQSSAQIHDQIYHHLVDDTTLSYPEAFLKRWIKMNADKPKSDEEVAAEYPTFIKQLQWALISSKLVEENDIKVEKEDLKSFAKNQLMQYLGGQMPVAGNESWIDDYAEKMMSDKKFVEDAYHQIRVSKLFQALETKVNITEEKVTEEEFTTKLHNHKH